MTTSQPEPIESRLDRLETIFADMGDVIVAQSEAIDALTANINNLGEQLTTNINNLAAEAAADRQQAAIDREAWLAEIQRIWQYLLQQGGNGRQGQ